MEEEQEQEEEEGKSVSTTGWMESMGVATKRQ